MARFLTLSRMEIHGFKSFYGRTRFEFPEGITAVVGPNGCGKSNIGDAISWVLGEQRASSLRSDRMEDVIFNGSEARRPLGMAEVSLHFKNAGGRGNGHGGNGHGEAAILEPTVPIPQAAEAPPLAASGEPEEIAPEEPAEAPDAEPQAAGTAPPARFFLEDLPDEVVVTRRLYRSGESEYILNGRRCRLRDIQDLLAATQVGSRLYSTIEQGKIDQILAAKPKDRRAMFEEAAGILGYKTRRRQAELKLEATQANLLRISDITTEVEKQINSLKRQAAKARRYRRLQDQLRERRARIARRRLAMLDGDGGRTLDAIQALRAREAAAAAELGAAESDLERLRLKLEEGEEAARRRRDGIHALDLEIDRVQGRLRAGSEQGRELASRAAGAGPEIAALLERAAGQESHAAGLAAEIETEAVRLDEAGRALEALEAAQRARAAAIEEAEAAQERTRAAHLEALDRLAALAQRRAALQEQTRAARTALDRLERETAEALGARDEAAAEVAARAERAAVDRARLQQAGAARDALAAEQDAATERLAAVERRAEEMKGRATALAERLAALKEMESRGAGFAEGIGELLRGGAGFTPAGVAGERLDVPPGLERAVEAALGERLEAVLVAERRDAARGIAHLKAGARGRGIFAPAPRAVPDRAAAPSLPAALAGTPGVGGILRDRVGGAPQAGDAVEAILARTVLVDDLDLALDLHAAWPDWSFVTAQGDVVHADGVVAGGAGGAVPHGLLARRAETLQIDREHSELERERQEHEATAARLREERNGLLERLEAAVSALQREERELFERELQAQQRASELDRIDRALPLLLGERERLEREIEGRAREGEALAAEHSAAEVRRAGLEESIRAAGEDLALRRAELGRFQAEASEAKAAFAAGRQRLQALTREREAVAEAIRQTRGLADRRSAERQEWSDRAAALAGQEEALRAEAETALRARAEAAAREEAGQAGLAYDRSLMHAREQSARETRAAHAAVREELQGLELRRARLEADLEHLARTCRDDLLTSLDALRATPEPPDEGRSLEDEETALDGTRAELDELGPVNLMAIEQHAELEERFGFLSAQRRDLEESIASLQDTIRKINRQSRERFMAAFEAIQATFQEVFTTLFGGGTARLRLQEGEDDVLEAGIEIAAQPPGKRLQALSLLSGGEKALTAVALLFSLFRYRPSPFCVLDEVDAPLDEANVERFTRLLHALRQETQFILITHNRKSMEAADLLYGVTMEEPGVSKVLPLRFE